MKINTTVVGPRPTEVRCQSLTKGDVFRTASGTLYVMCDYDSTCYFAFNLSRFALETFMPRTLVEPVQVESIDVRIQLLPTPSTVPCEIEVNQ